MVTAPAVAQLPTPRFRSTGALSPVILNDKMGEVLSSSDANVPATGDAQPALQAQINAIAAAGGGPFRLLNRQYSIVGADLEIPADVRVFCDGSHGGLRPTLNYTAVPCALMPGPGRTVRMDDRAALDNVPVIYGGLAAPPTDMRSGITYINSFAGTGITVQGNDVRIEGGFILGFDLCISNVGFARLHADVNGDCNNGIKNDQNHDIVRLGHTEFWPFGLTGVSWGLVNYPILNYANNGAGLVRLGMTSTAGLVTGDTISLSLTSGLPRNLRRRWAITVVDGTHVDLPGAAWPAAATFAAALVSGSPLITVSDNSQLGRGMAVSGAGIPANTTIVDIVEARVLLSAQATATSSNVELSATPLSNQGGRAWVDLTYRPGIAYEFTNGERNECDSCFDFGYRVGLHLGTRAGWTYAPGYASDGMETEDTDKVGILITDDAYDSILSDCWISSKARALVVQSTAGPAHKLTNCSFNVGSTLSSIQLLSGDTILTGSTLAPEVEFGNGAGYVASAIHSVIWGNNNLNLGFLLFQNGVAPPGFSTGNINAAAP